MSKSALLDFKKSEFRKNRVKGEFKEDLELKQLSLSQNKLEASLSEQMPNNDFLDTLKPEIRGLVKMRVLDELSFAEMAKLTGSTEASLRQVLSRAFKKLRNTFSNPKERKDLK
jgi:DNA-directed RNA polymerase specialized sigma24 family protein